MSADPRLHQLTIRRMGADRARQRQKLHRPLQRHAFRRPALRQAGPGWFGIGLARLALLDVGPKPPGPQRDRLAIRIQTQHGAIGGKRAAFLTAAKAVMRSDSGKEDGIRIAIPLETNRGREV